MLSITSYDEIKKLSSNFRPDPRSDEGGGGSQA
jgi:hypothetical protein